MPLVRGLNHDKIQEETLNAAEWLLKEIEAYCDMAISRNEEEYSHDVVGMIKADIDKYFLECKIAERGRAKVH